MASEHSGCDNSIDEIKHELEFKETIREELNRESECENSYHEQFVKWCEPDLVKLEDLQTDNVKCEIDDSKLESDEDDKPLKNIIEGVAVEKEDPGDYPEDPLDTPGCGEVKIEDELDIKDEDVKIETDEEEMDEDDSEDEAALFQIFIMKNATPSQDASAALAIMALARPEGDTDKRDSREDAGVAGPSQREEIDKSVFEIYYGSEAAS
ncbi:hypothetical protein JTB14_009642 [Gonioctena quinquepunctata]|nr:hypothetical protein JTB14_009642 [Gonioctena quinquepunctata]